MMPARVSKFPVSIAVALGQLKLIVLPYLAPTSTDIRFSAAAAFISQTKSALARS